MYIYSINTTISNSSIISNYQHYGMYKKIEPYNLLFVISIPIMLTFFIDMHLYTIMIFIVKKLQMYLLFIF